MNNTVPPPPPPDDPFTNNTNGGEYDAGGLDTGAPAVAASKGKTMVIMGGLGLVVLYMLYSIFFGGSGEEEADAVEEEARSAPSRPAGIRTPSASYRRRTSICAATDYRSSGDTRTHRIANNFT
jgi:hypothetical protein